MLERSYEKFFRQNRLPHLWCPGCGNGIAMKAIVQAIEKKPNFTQDNTVIVSGIGCSSRASGYMDFDNLVFCAGNFVVHAFNRVAGNFGTADGKARFVVNQARNVDVITFAEVRDVRN